MLKRILVFGLLILAKAAIAQVYLSDSMAAATRDSLFYQPKALRFIAMGDWGRNGADHQQEVAAQMGRTANVFYPQFIISTGDNFYPSGVASEWDPLWHYSFENIYTDFRLQWDWYPVLGNHDYKSDPDAQVRYSKISRRWQMPARYYSKLLPLSGDTASKVLFLFIDTNPLIPEFYANAEYGPHVKTQDSTRQKKWIEKQLKSAPASVKWKIVIGHHPMYTGGSRTEGYDTKAIRRSLEPLFTKYGVDLYIAGHEHSLQHINTNGKLHHFISGAASEKTKAGLIPGSKMAASVYGFMNFSLLRDAIIVQAIDDSGTILYTTRISK
jgi:tartrate-resistant acid phosphatase type 5